MARMIVSLRRAGLLGLCWIALFVVGALAPALASAALPEQSPTSGTFTGTSGAGTFETRSGEKIVCKEDAISGIDIGAKGLEATLTYKGCEAFSLKCNSSGAASGVIVLQAKGLIVYTNVVEKKVGIIYTLKQELTVKCTALETFKMKGSILCRVTPVNTKTTLFSDAFTETKGVEEPTEYINEAGERVKAPIMEVKGEGLKTFAFEQAGLGGTESLTLATEGEIKA